MSMRDLTELVKYGSVSIEPGLYTQNNMGWTYGETSEGERTAVVVVGCGGTGGRIIPLLAQHIKNHNQTIQTAPNNKLHIKHKMKLVLIDADEGIEAKNLRRQNFFEFDLGKQKAEVMAKRYGALYGMDIEYYNSVFDKNLFSDMQRYSNIENYIIFDHTDNKKARESIEEMFIFTKNIIIISTGNEEDFGQVVVSSKASKATYYASTTTDMFYLISSYFDDYCNILNAIRKEDSKNKVKLKNVPSFLKLYPDFKDTVKPSCTDITLIDDQSMPINSLVAQLAYNVFYTIIAGQELNYHMVKCNINNSYSTSYISHPLDALSLYARAILGDSNTQLLNDTYDTIMNYLNDITLKAPLTDIINNCDIKYLDPIYKIICYMCEKRFITPQEIHRVYSERKTSANL